MKEVEKMNIVFNRFNSRNNKDSEYYFTKLLSFPYKEDEGWGFSNVEQNDNFLEITLLKRLPTYFSSWNEDLNIMEKKTIQIVKEVKFYMDFGRGLLSCEGGITNLNYVKQALRLSFWKEFVYEDLKMVPYDYLTFLMKDDYLSEIKEITINDFNYNDIVIGKYIARIVNPSLTEGMLLNYSKSISRIKALMLFENEEFEIVINSRNCISASCSEENKYYLINYLSFKIY